MRVGSYTCDLRGWGRTGPEDNDHSSSLNLDSDVTDVQTRLKVTEIHMLERRSETDGSDGGGKVTTYMPVGVCVSKVCE